MSLKKLTCRINGREYKVEVEPETLLVDLLRDQLLLTGTKAGCREGECGACTILMDGLPVNSCLVPALKAQGKKITTIEGLAKPDGSLDEIQEAFMTEGASQCGFCTPGMILNAKALIDSQPDPAEEDIRQALSGVLCRCTGYAKIITAVKTAARNKRGSRPNPS